MVGVDYRVSNLRSPSVFPAAVFLAPCFFSARFRATIGGIFSRRTLPPPWTSKRCLPPFPPLTPRASYCATFSPPHRHHRRVELGYTIARAYWGNGYATEAVQALLQFGLERMGLVRIEAVVLPDHVASARVLEKAGMTFEGLLHSYQIWRGRPCDLKMYAVTRV